MPSQRSPSHSRSIACVPFFLFSTLISSVDRACLCTLHCALICSHMFIPGAVNARLRDAGREYVAHAPRQESGGRPPVDGAGPGPRGFGDSLYSCSLVQVLVAGEGEEIDELVLGGD